MLPGVFLLLWFLPSMDTSSFSQTQNGVCLSDVIAATEEGDAVDSATTLSGVYAYEDDTRFLSLRGGASQGLFLPAVGERIVELLRSVVKLLLWWRRDSSPLEVVQGLELDSFLGTWYEIASIKRSFQRDLGDVTAQYSLSDKPNVLKVTNAGRRKEGKGAQASISGTARLLNPKKGAGKFKITFRVLGGVLPLMAPYWVVEIGDKGLFSNNYTYAVVVNGEQRSAAWVLSRSPTMSDRQFKGIKARLKEMGVPTEKLTLTKQQVSDYWQLNQ